MHGALANLKHVQLIGVTKKCIPEIISMNMFTDMFTSAMASADQQIPCSSFTLS